MATRLGLGVLSLIEDTLLSLLFGLAFTAAVQAASNQCEPSSREESFLSMPAHREQLGFRSGLAVRRFVLSLKVLMSCRRLKPCLTLLAFWVLLGAGFRAGFPPDEALAASPQRSAMETLQEVERRYNRLRTVRLRFQQFYRQNNQVLRGEEGTLYLSKPGQMRWEYEDPEPKLFLSDGQRLVLYVPSENRMTETAVKSSDDLRTPLRLLLGQLRLQDEFKEIIEGPFEIPPLEKGNIVLKATPKHLEDRLEWVVFEVSPQHEIRRIIASEPGGLQTEFRFEDEEGNIPLSSRLFRFEPPPGTEIVRQ